MFSDPDIQEIALGQRGMVRGIEACLAKDRQCLVSAMLIYSTIDALAAMTRPKAQLDTDRDTFKAWVAKYLLDGSLLGCTSEDLYGARCGVLHTYGMDSERRRKGKARALVYKWREGPQPSDGGRNEIPPDATTLCVEDLYDALRRGVENFLSAIDANEELRSRVAHHKANLLCYRPWTPVEIHVAA